MSGNGVEVDHQADSFEKVMVLAVDSTFYRIFDYPMLTSGRNIGRDGAGITITEKLALRIFGRSDVLGEGLKVHNDTLEVMFTVAAVMRTMDENTHLRFDALVPFHTFDRYLSASTTYLQLSERASKEELEAKISRDKDMPSLVGPGGCDYLLQPLPDIYFDKGNVKKFTTARSPDLINALWLIIFLILFIGVFNFLNLFIVTLVDRRKEFGVRKIQGASGADIRVSIVFEIFVYLCIGFIISIMISVLFLPVFNQMFESEIVISYLFRPMILISLAALFVSLVVIVSLVLTFYLNRIQPVNLLKEKSILRVGFNKGFFTLQFAISLALILAAVVIIKQVRFIKNKPLGFDREIVELFVPTEGKISDLIAMKARLDQLGIFKSISLSSGNPVSGNQQIRFDLSDQESYSAYFMEGDEDLLKTLGLHLKAGRGLSALAGKDKVVNEKFVKYFNINDPIGAPIPGGNGERIIGVVSDFNVSSFRQDIPLYIIGYSEFPSRLLINYSGAAPEDVMPLLEAHWSEIFPNSPFICTFPGDELLFRHRDDFQFGQIVITFSAVSILISCFGLFALAQNTFRKKGKEIAIRKSLGASIRDVVYFLMVDFGKWVVLSFIIACIPGYLGIQRWTETFTFHTEIDWKVFAVTSAIGIFFFLLAISFQTIRAAKANPINGLRYE